MLRGAGRAPPVAPLAVASRSSCAAGRVSARWGSAKRRKEGKTSKRIKQDAPQNGGQRADRAAQAGRTLLKNF